MTNLGVIDPPSIEFDPTHDQIIDPIGRNIGETQIKLEQPNIQTSSMKISIPTYKIKPILKPKPIKYVSTKRIPTILSVPPMVLQS
uniref:Uncharacterized protein n=1 Tax=Gossypium raimondii TaxID=29730 RepID=A0A0D2TUY3_GOSRA|nr:hypothetical protein B456_009G309700 [Gossypium raimondii]